MCECAEKSNCRVLGGVKAAGRACAVYTYTARATTRYSMALCCTPQPSSVDGTYRFG